MYHYYKKKYVAISYWMKPTLPLITKDNTTYSVRQQATTTT